MCIAKVSVMVDNVKPEQSSDSLVWQDFDAPPSFPLRQYSSHDRLPASTDYRSSSHGHQLANTHNMVLADFPRTLAQQDMRSIRQTTVTALTSHQSLPNLKRSFQELQDSPPERPSHYLDQSDKSQRSSSVQGGHGLLSFKRAGNGISILDFAGRHTDEILNAQIHGMFFLAEKGLPSRGRISKVTEPELTCYRRNLFQVSGNVAMPRGPTFITAEDGTRKQILSQQVSVSATESTDHHPVRLIVIPWKTPPPNSPVIESTPDHEPQAIQLAIPNDEAHEINQTSHVECPFNWPRLQFRIATANNGRRRELQQHFVLHLTVNATLLDGTQVKLSEYSTAPIIVRGRSPRNFRAKNEIPLVGSASLRQEIQRASASKVIPKQPMKSEPRTPKPLNLPQTGFMFDSSHLPTSPSFGRQDNYQHWSSLNQILRDRPDARSMSLDMSATSQTTYSPSFSGSYSNPYDPDSRPLKSPRHSTNSGSSFMRPLPSSSGPSQHVYHQPATTRSEQNQSYISEFQHQEPATTDWASSQVLSEVHSIPMPPVPSHFPQELYMKDEPLLHHHYTWNPQ